MFLGIIIRSLLEQFLLLILYFNWGVIDYQRPFQLKVKRQSFKMMN